MATRIGCVARHQKHRYLVKAGNKPIQNTLQVNMTISLAFLAPNLVRAAVEGRLPRGIGVERLPRQNGADSLRRSESIRNNRSAGPPRVPELHKGRICRRK